MSFKRVITLTIPPPKEKDYRAWIAFGILIITGLITFYGMYLGWTTTEILAILAFFGPLLTAAITYYFVQKTEEKLART
jgi:drug/metabolite transporter (DMT)-like permease